MTLSDLLRTKIHLTALRGHVIEHPDSYELHTPTVPSFFHGNCLVLKSPPTDFHALRTQFAECFGADTRHELFVWGGEAASDAVLRDAQAADFRGDSSVALALSAPPPADERWSVRILTPLDAVASDALNMATDGSSGPDGDPSYVEFKTRLRTQRRRWAEDGTVTWWGAFDGDELVGQCGLACCDSEIGAGLGRFQAVEVHPSHRRRGVASSLVATVAHDAFIRLCCPRVLLEADPRGPALALYRRLGFRTAGDVHDLLRSDGEVRVRSERAADEAGVRTLVTAAFGQPDEARLVDALRARPAVLSLVAERDGRLMGHVMFSPVTVATSAGTPRAGVALAPLAVHPDDQRGGVGSALTRAGLDACRAAGHNVCFVLGDPSYYGRFGFESAAPHGLTCRWPAPEGAFQVMELAPGALSGCTGRVEYDGAFGLF